MAVFSNERLPEVLSATFQSGSTNTLVRLEPINSIDRIVEDRIGGGPSQIIDTTNLGAHVTPFTLADVTLFVSNGGGLFTFDAISGGLETTIQTTYAGLTLGDLDMRTDGRLFAYAGVAADATTAGRLLELDTGTGGIRFDGDDNVTNVAAGTDDNRQTTTNSVTALAFRRTGVGAYADLWYVVQDGGTSKLYRAESGGTAAGNPTANAFGAAGANFGYRGRIVVDLDANGRYDGAGEQPLVTGLQFADDSGGVLFGVTADGKLLSLQPATSNPDLTDLGLVTVATIVADFSSDLADIGAAGFTALAAAPRNLYGGELQGRFFALTNTGRLALLNPAGVSAASDAGQFGLLERSGDVGGSIYVQGETVGEVVAQAGTLGVATEDGTRLATETVGSYGGGITRTASSAALERQTTAYVSGTLTSIPVTPSARQFDRLVVAGTGSLTAGQSSVTGLGTATIGQLFVGMLVNGAGVPAGTRIQSISGSTVTLSAPATASGANVALEFSVPRLLLDSVRPVVAQMLAAGDGIPWGTTVLQVGQEGAQSWVALSADPVAFSDGDPVAFYRRIANITRNSDGSPNLVVQPSIFADLAVGMRITSTGLTTETRITAIDAATNTITLSQSLTAGPVTLSIYGVTTFFGIAPAVGMVVLGNGVPFNTIGQADGSLSKPIGEVTGESARAFSPLVITDAPTTIGSPSVTLAAAIRGQLAVGMPVVGVGITPGTTVTAITATGITLSRPATATQATATLRFLGLGSLATSDTTLELTSVAGVTVDMLVEGTTLGWGTTVTAVDPATRTITLSDPVAIPNPSLTLRFYGLVAGNLAGTASDFTVTLPGGVTGLLPGMVGGLTVNTVVEQVDPVAGTVRLSRIVPPGPPSVFSFYGVTTIAGIGGLQDGWLITGPGIPYDTRIVVAGGTTSPSRPVAQFADRTLSAFGPELTATVTLTAGNAGITGLTPPQLALLATGMTAVGEGVPPNTTITVAGGVVTLSQPATLTGSSSVLFLDTESFAREPRVIAVDSTAGLTTGMLVVGPGIPWGTVVAAVGATQVTVDRNLESPQAGVALDFFTSAGLPRTGTAAGVTVDLPGGTAGVAAGMWVTGGGLTLPTRVLAVDAGNQRVTLDRAPAAGAVTLSFYGVRRIEVADATGIQTGMLAFGVGVPLGTRVAGVVGTTITLDQTVGEVATGRMDFIASLNRTATRITGVSNEVTINDASGLRIGMLLFGTGIPPHITVTNIVGQTVTLSADVTFPTSTAARFVQPDAAFAADANAGSALVEVAGGFADVPAASVRGLRPGMLVLGAGIREGTLVVGVTVTGGVATVTLSQLALGDGGLALRFIDGRTVRVARTPATLELLPGMSVTPTPPAAAGATIAALDFAAPGGEVVVVMSAPAQTTTAATQLVFRTAAAASGNIDCRIIDVALPTSFEGLTGDLLVFGIGILDGTTAVAVNQVAGTITLSQPATRADAANEIRLVRADQTKLSSTTVALPLDQITVNNTTGLAVGMLVFAPDVPRNARITAIAGTTLTLSDERPVAAVTSGTAYFVQPDLAVDAQPPGGNPAVLSLAALTPAAFNAVHVGMLVFGEGLPANTRIVAVNRAARTLTLSAPAAAGVQRYSFVRDGRVVANVESLTNISVGDEVVGLGLAATDGLPAGTLVARVATNPADINDYGQRTIVLTQAAYRDELGKRLVFTTPGATTSVVLGGLTSTAMLRPGMVVFADELEPLAPVTIQSIDTLTSITLDKAVPLGTTLSDVIFVTQVSLDNPLEAQATATAGSNVITMVATDAIRMGMLVVGTGIPYNTVVTGKTATDLTLSKPATGSVTDDYDFVNTSSVEYLADWSGATTLFNFSPVLAAGATGLAFSPLDINLWHPTTQRGTEAGHGINAAPDGTRAPAPGGTSLYFGLEQLTGAQYGGSTAWQQDLLANPAIGNNYNLPGGAYGSLTTNPFDLTGYDYTDKPTLYFNYWLQTENAGAGLDTARAWVSRDGGVTWELVATSSPTRNNTTSALPAYPSVSSALSVDPRQAVQQLFATSQWRQARIDLGNWAGEADLRLRFEFTTGSVTTAARGQNNQFEGFYIDDILVGFAERGEMVTAAPVGQTGFYEINSPTSGFFSQQILSGPYQLEIRRGTVYVDDTFSIAQTFDTNDRLVPELGLSVLGEFQQGDRNALREQGQFFIQGNIISDTAQYGVRIDAGIRDPLTNAPIPGVPRNLPVLNNARLAPGAVVVNNVIVGSGTAGILFSGDPNTGNVPPAAVPFGRIVNNTIVGGQTRQGVGVGVTQNGGPTLLNNLFASLATAVSVDTSSRFDGAGNQRTVVGTSAYFDVGTQVLGVNQQFPLVLTGNPFVNPANRNYYLRQGSSAIDSALNSLQDRPEYVVVNSEIGIGQLPILAPEQDVYGQLRGDDPTQPSAPGLGANVFKDRGAIERVDYVAPFATLVVPEDDGPQDVNLTADTVRLEREDARNRRRFEIQLQDLAVGIDRATVLAGAFTLTRNGTVLQDGVDYTFFFVELTDRVVFEAPAAFQQGTYLISVARELADGDLVNVVKDLAGNALRANRPDGTTQFTIELVDVPLAPTNLAGTSGDGQVSLTWVASPGVITQYEVEWAIDALFAVVDGTMQVTPPALNATIVSLTNGTPYWFRVRAVNAVGESEWSNTAGPIVPLNALTLGLVTDTGRLPNDRVTNDRRVAVGNVLPGAAWEYSTDAGQNWVPGVGNQFDLAERVYSSGAVQVRQTMLGSVGAVSQSVGAWTIDLTRPTAAGVLLASGVTSPVSLSQALALSGIVGVTGESTATISVVFSRNGVILSPKTRIGGGTIALTSGDLATLGDGLITVTATQVDLAGNAQLPPASMIQFTLDTTPPAVPVITGVVDDVLPVTGTVANGGRTNDPTPTVQGVAEPGSTVVVLVNGTQRGTVTANFSGTWTLTLPTLADGTYAITARATDAVGNTSALSAAYTITIDRLAPTAPVITGVTDDASPVVGNVPSGGRTNDSTPTITGTAEPGSTVTVLLGGVEITPATVASGTGVWSLTTASLGDGTYVITARATDAAGNQSGPSASYTITIDTTGPAAPVITGVVDDVPLVTGNVPSGGRTNDSRPTISGTAEAGSTVTVLLNGEAQAPTTAGGTGVWSLTTTALPDGTYSITTRATDAVGNTGVASAVHTITIDTVAPTLTALAAPAGTYRVGQSISVTATLSEPVAGGGVVVIGLNTGATVTLTAVANTTTATGTYIVQTGQTTSRLRATSISIAANPIADLAGNAIVSTALPSDQDNFGAGTGVAVDGDVKLLPVPPNFSTNPLQVVNLGRSVTEIPVRFTAPVVGVTLAAFELYLDGRRISLGTSTLTGSGDNYVLRLPDRQADASAVYELVVRADTGIRAASNAATMKQPGRLFWGRDRNVSIASTVIESAGLVTLSYDAMGRLWADQTRVTTQAGSAVDYSVYRNAGWTARAAEAVSGVNTLVWRNQSGELQFWRLSAGWTQVASEGQVSPGSPAFAQAEVDFGVDFDGDGEIGRSVTVIESTGAVTLAYNPAGSLLVNGLPVTSGGSAVNYRTFVSWGWTARAAETIGGVNTIVWQNAARELHLWSLSAGWAHQASRGNYAVGTAAFNATEAAFGMDFDGDGQVAPATTLIENRGDVALEYDGVGSLRANGVLLTSGGRPVNFDTLRSWGWTARAAETVGGVNTIVWQNQAGELHFWRLSAGWAHERSEGNFGPGSPQYAVAEGDFGVDLDGDGRITIESAGSVTLSYDEVGVLRANQTPVNTGGNPANYHLFRSWGWEAVAADVVNGGNRIAWRNLTTGGLQYWRLNSAWAHLGSEADDRPGSPGYSQAELDFQVDFDRDGGIGAGVVVIESRGGVVLQRAGNGNLLANGVLVQSGGRPVNYFTLLSWGWTALAADVVNGVNTIAWRNSAGQLHLWRLSAGWLHERSEGNFAPGTPEFETARQALELDI